MSVESVDIANHASGPECILVIDDHPLFCEALSMAIRRMHNGAKVHSAPGLVRGLELIEGEVRPDLILLDLNLPDTQGLEGLVRLRRRLPETPVVIISSVVDSEVIAQSMNAGAAGYIPKDTARSELEVAFRRIWSGDTFTPACFVPMASKSEEGPTASDAARLLAELTPQQTRILELICAGRLNKQIAFELEVAESTVKAHVSAILRKLGAHSRVQALLIAQKARLSGAGAKEL